MEASSAFRLLAGEPVGEDLARIALGRIDHARDELVGLTESTPEQAVHEARKDMKRLRAVLRLVRGEVAGKTYRRENAAFRDTAALLSGARDADVMLATLGALEERHPGDLPPDAAGGLRQALEAHRRRLAAEEIRAAEAAERLAVARDRVPAWMPTGDGFGLIETGLAGTYRHGRRAAALAARKPTDENLHDWRKQVKYLWHQLQLLREAWPAALAPLGRAAHDLSDRLGDDHDLAVLWDFAGGHASGFDGLDDLGAVVAARRAELQAEAHALGARLYAEKPSPFTERIAALHDAWKTSPRPER